jgi:hypothetical protein
VFSSPDLPPPGIPVGPMLSMYDPIHIGGDDSGEITADHEQRR